MEAFIYEHIIPEFRDVFGTTSNVPKVLGLALLWAVMDGTLDHCIPPFVLQQICQEYNAVKQLPEGINPVKKVSTICCQCLLYCHSLLHLLLFLLQV
jgi:hypothetical protein